MSKAASPLFTPDGRYLVVLGRLWRAANPGLSPADRDRLVLALMAARFDVGRAKRTADEALMRAARDRVQAAKVALGERGPVWLIDGTPDLNRKMVANTPYSDWYTKASRLGMS